MDDSEERIIEEVEALQAILMDEVSVKNNEKGIPEVVESTVVPATADDTNQQYVRVTLEVTLPHGYPETPPSIALRNPRGLDDDTLIAIKNDASDKIKASKGLPVIYDLIEVLCPVCREPINCDIAVLQQAAPPLAVQMAQKFEPDESLRTLQEEMAKLYLHQKSRGGIIDPDAADSKVLLVTETASPPASPPPRWQQRLQAQRAAQQQQQQRPPKPAKPPRPARGDAEHDDDEADHSHGHGHGRQRRAKFRGGPRSHRNR